MKVIEKAIKHLLDTKPFYACFFLSSQVKYDQPGVTTAAAGVNRFGPVLIFNTEFISSLEPKQVGAVVEHEILHLLFEHHESYKKHLNLVKNIANIAMDCSINQFIESLPEIGVTVDRLNKELNLSLPLGETWEFYYAALIQKAKELQGRDSFDQHGAAGDESGDDLAKGEPLSEDGKRSVLRSAIDSALKGCAGNAPSEVLKVFQSLKYAGKVPWQQVLSNFVARATSSTVQNTRKKINRRFGLEQPGKKKKRELTLGVCVDSSGSISDESFQMFLEEVGRISTVCQVVYLVDADCIIHSVTKIKKSSSFKRERRGAGGTAYQPAIDECVKRACDAIVYFGDFDCADSPKNPGLPFLWVGVGNQKKPGDFGGEIRI